jgi:SWI/SNF-related matrix-associated actin-dependent regulator 1 of chromatin subfamily A
MLNPKAVAKFLARKRTSFDWMKACTHEELDAALGGFNSTKLWDHQKVCLLILLELKRFMLHLDLGAGKTLISLSLLRYRKQCGEHPKAIVFVPYLTSVETWVEEVAKHAPDLRCVPCLGTTGDNLVDLGASSDLCVICYSSAVAAVSYVVPGTDGQPEWQLSAKEVRRYFKSFDTIILDEVHKCSKVTSLTYRMCRAISAQCDWAIGLTGTPFGKNLQALWPQFNLIDFGDTLGPTLGFYRSVFFNKHDNPFNKRATDYTFIKAKLPELKRIIKNKSIHYGIREFYDMPPKRYIVKNLRCPDATLAYSEATLKLLRAAQKGGQYREVESNYLKLRQLSSGFMTLRGEDNDKLEAEFESNPKLEVLVDIVTSLRHGVHCVIFHYFIYSGLLVSRSLTAAGVNHAHIYGRTKNPIAELRRFKNDKNCPVLLLNIKSGSSSLNLQNANYVVFFEQPDDPIDRQQAEGRVWRPGQTEPVFIIDLLVRKTADHGLHASNKAGASLLKELFTGRSTI